MAQRRTERVQPHKRGKTIGPRGKTIGSREDVTCKSCQYQYYDRSLIMSVKENKTVARTRTTAHDNFIYRFANVVPGPPPPWTRFGGEGGPPPRVGLFRTMRHPGFIYYRYCKHLYYRRLQIVCHTRQEFTDDLHLPHIIIQPIQTSTAYK